MGRYTGPKGRINRRLGVNVYESSGSIKALERKEYPPGMHRRRKKPTIYGIGLAEKQKIKFCYGLRDRQLNRYFNKARHMKGNTGELLLIICETRLDNVVRRSGFTFTRPQARQGIVHRHFQVNGVTTDKPGFMVQPGDVITVRNRPTLRQLYKQLVESTTSPQSNWISFDPSKLEAVVSTLPTYDDVTLHVDVGKVVAFLSR